ncbi:MAG: MBL fold metallo-hydrolase [Christensenellales bacterium]
MIPIPETEVLSYDIIVIGHQRANVYFGDDPRNPPRGKPVTCTSTLIRGLDENRKPYALMVDPTTRADQNAFYFDLERRTGLKPKDITHCFCTHEHFDHIEGFAYFPDAKWLAPAPNLFATGASMLIDKAMLIPVEGEFLPGVYAAPLPGHTHGLHGISFRYRKKRYIIAGDAVVSRHHFDDLANNFEDDIDAACKTQQQIKAEFDVVIPGHDNLIIIR